MMPPLDELRVIVDRAERWAMQNEPELGRRSREERRRLLAWAAFYRLREGQVRP